MFGLAKLAGEKKVSEHIQGPGYERNGVNYGVSIKKDENGYYACTHRARSKSFPSIEAIPISKLEKVDATG